MKVCAHPSKAIDVSRGVLIEQSHAQVISKVVAVPAEVSKSLLRSRLAPNGLVERMIRVALIERLHIIENGLEITLAHLDLAHNDGFPPWV